jgi:hypothetical protein
VPPGPPWRSLALSQLSRPCGLNAARAAGWCAGLPVGCLRSARATQFSMGGALAARGAGPVGVISQGRFHMQHLIVLQGGCLSIKGNEYIWYTPDVLWPCAMSAPGASQRAC